MKYDETFMKRQTDATSTINFSQKNNSGQMFLITISMIYMSILLCNAILTNRYVGTNEMFLLGGSLTSPFIFIFCDIVAEIYGYKIARYLIWSGFIGQIIFTLICQFIVNAPHPEVLTAASANAYNSILGYSLFRINISGFAAYMIASLVNAKILTRWKILLKGKKFWLRSLGASTFSEALYTIIAIIMMQLNTIPNHDMFKVILFSFIIKLIYSALFAFPANCLVNYIKKISGVDTFDLQENYTPSKFLRNKGDSNAISDR